jgi:hypothetical protein
MQSADQNPGQGPRQGQGPMQMIMADDIDADELVLTEEQQQIMDDYLDTIRMLSDSLNFYPIQDDTIRTVLNDEIAHYFDGSRTAAEVIDTLHGKINLYLNE